MDTRYNVYFAGEVREGFDPSHVRKALGKLFKTDDATLDRLFSGNQQLLKKDCDEATAAKYQQAMRKAGAEPIIRPATEQTPPAQDRSQSQLTAAERIAALAAAPDKDDYRSDRADPLDVVTYADVAAGEAQLQAAPPGTPVLTDEERPATATPMSPDTSALEVDPSGERLSPEPPPAPPPPDTDQFGVAAVGERIPNLPADEPSVDPDTSGIQLSPEGTDFSDCKPAELESLELDLAGFALAPEGSLVLDEQYRRTEPAEAPSTDHISLQD
ncbi:MAG: hypothetical protein AAGA91_18355 [Pseudomonadota bacterium]